MRHANVASTSVESGAVQFRLKSKLLCTAIAALSLTACTVEPFTYKDSKGREVASLGGGILRKSKARNLSITKSDGTVIKADTTEEDETRAASVWLTNKLGGKALDTTKDLGSQSLNLIKK